MQLVVLAEDPEIIQELLELIALVMVVVEEVGPHPQRLLEAMEVPAS
jgi:hypothetical protein